MAIQKKIKYALLTSSLITVLIISFFNFEAIKKVYIRILKKNAIIQHFNSKGQREGEFLSYLNGKLYVKADFINGLREGWVIKYYKNGEIQNKTFYNNDKRDGEEYGYYENGKLNYESHWRNGKYYGDGWNWQKNGKLFVYNTTDISDLFYYSEFDSLGRPNKIVGNLFSSNIYSIDNRNDSIVTLSDRGMYGKIKDLYITVATPPKLSTQIDIKINNHDFTHPKILDNTIRIENAFMNRGTYRIYIKDQLLDRNSRVLKLDTLSLIITKI